MKGCTAYNRPNSKVRPPRHFVPPLQGGEFATFFFSFPSLEGCRPQSAGWFFPKITCNSFLAFDLSSIASPKIRLPVSEFSLSRNISLIESLSATRLYQIQYRIHLGADCVQLQVGHLTLAPFGIDGSAKITLASFPTSAASSIPCDSTPRSFAGTRFATRIIFFPMRSSGLYHA